MENKPTESMEWELFEKFGEDINYLESHVGSTIRTELPAYIAAREKEAREDEREPENRDDTQWRLGYVYGIKQTRASVLTQVKDKIEKMYGEKGKRTGSFGYQGLVMGITAFESPEDKIRNDILSLIEDAGKE
jgi:hypothetical protein